MLAIFRLGFAMCQLGEITLVYESTIIVGHNNHQSVLLCVVTVDFLCACVCVRVCVCVRACMHCCMCVILVYTCIPPA